MKLILGIFNLFICFLVFSQTEKRPNILFIISDDQDAETLDFYGDKSCDTPVIDQLSKDGISLTSAYHMGSYRAAVCTPSRIMLMTGRNLFMKSSWLEQGLNIGRARKEEKENRLAVEKVIKFLQIESIRKTPVSKLPYGLQKRVELGRALVAEPKILYLTNQWLV